MIRKLCCLYQTFVIISESNGHRQPECVVQAHDGAMGTWIVCCGHNLRAFNTHHTLA